MVVLLLAAALGAAAGYGLAWRAGNEHVATATIMLHPLEGNAYSPGGRGDDLVNLETEAQVLRSDAVARAVLQRLGAPGTPADLLATVAVDVPPNTQLLEISVRGPDDATAVARASAFAEVYLAFRRARTESSVFGRTSRIEELVEEREDERLAAVARLADLPAAAPQRRLIEQQVQEVVAQIGSLRTQLATAQAIGLDPGQVVTPGHVPDRGRTADPVVMSGASATAALLLALALLAVRAGRGTATLLHDPEDLEEAGVVPLGAVRTPVQPGDDAIARARSVVLAAGPDRHLVVSVAALGDGRPATFEALAESLTRARYEVVAIDLSDPRERRALAELVLQQAVASDVLEQDGEFRSRLRPLAEGHGPIEEVDDFGDLVASAQMRTCLEDLAKRCDLVLVAAPGLGTPAGRALLTASRTVLVEVRPGESRRPDLVELVAETDRLGGHLAGAVLVTVGTTARGGHR